MKRLLGTLAAIVISLSSIAQTVKLSVSGKVIDAATKAPVVSASVRLGDNLLIADENGQFVFKKLTKGGYQLVVSSVGFAEKVEKIDLVENKTNWVIELNNSPLFLDALEVKSLRASDQAPFTKTNLDKATLAKNNLGQDLPFLLNQTPSTTITSDAGNGVGYTNIYIRGVDASRINVTLNGIPYNDAESQGTYFVNLPDFTSSVSSIQIQRGVGTSSNGTGAFGAGINLQTNEYNEKAYAEFNNSYGSFNTIKNTVKAGTGLINDHFTVDARLSRISSDGYIDRATSNLQSFAISAAFINQKTSLRLNIFSGKEKTYQAWYGIPDYILPTNRTYNVYTYPNQTDNYQQNHYQFFINHSFNKRWSFNTAAFFTPGKGYYEEYQTGAYYESYGLPNHIVGTDTATTTDLVRQRWLDNKFYGQIGALQFKTSKDLVILGGGWSRYEGAHFGNILWAQYGGIDKDYQWYHNQALKADANVYAKWEHQLNKNWTLYADLQYKYVFHRMNGFDSDSSRVVSKEFNFLNPKIGLSYHANGLQVYASYAVANKEPNRTDFENATNYNPSAERLNDVEAGIEKKGKGYSYGATFYFMDYKDQLVLTGKLNDAGYPIRINTPKSHRLGIELQGAVAATDWLHLSGNVTFSSNKIDHFTEYIYKYDSTYAIIGDTVVEHSQTNISFSPTTIASATISLLPCKYVELGLISKFVSKQFLDNTQDDSRSLSDYYAQDARIILQVPSKWMKNCSIIGRANNIFNRLYEANGATYPAIDNTGTLASNNYYYPMAGTNFMVGVNIKL